jgi:hypothetical protein
MKKILLFFVTIILFASWSMAQTTFSPTVMEITCPAELNYEFGDDPLEVPFTVSGVPGAFWLVINTYGKADQINQIQNGFLGWHYVDKLDTTVYVSGRYQRDLGDQKIAWDGTNADGDKVSEDTYTYHIWGYDDASPRQKVTDFVPGSNTWDSPMNTMYTYDEQGMLLEKPFFFGNRFFHWADDEVAWKRFGTAWKWEIGSNPEDLNNLETTWMPFYVDRAFCSNYAYGGPVLVAGDYSQFVHTSIHYPSATHTMLLWSFVAGGDASFDADWLGWDQDIEWEGIEASGYWSERPTVYANPDGSEPYIYGTQPAAHLKQRQWDPLVVVTLDGDIVFRKMMDEWFMPNDNNPRDDLNGTPISMSTRGNNIWQYSSWLCCLQEVIDTTKLLADPDDDEDYIKWQNSNGDYFVDKFWWEDAETPWACLDNYTGRGAVTNAALDKEMFGMYGRGVIGTTCLTVLSQDGTGVADVTYFGVDASPYTYNSHYIDSGSQYDGIYCPPPKAEEIEPHGMWFVTFDSGGGMIVPGAVEPGVEEDAQAAYALGQNAPNPFNPTTTIGFALAEAGNVTIDVYNVAGQKIDTLVNDFMEAGSHSVVWNASGFSAGVYFYTIKSGDFTKTMKMTLLK